MELVTCVECKRELNEFYEKVWVKVYGWESKRSGGGTNHIALREPVGLYMCGACMTLKQMGLDPNQGSLL